MNGQDFLPPAEAVTEQQQIVLGALRQRPHTTLELRSLFVASPAARVLELKRQGHSIATFRAGRFARYALLGDKP